MGNENGGSCMSDRQNGAPRRCCKPLPAGMTCIQHKPISPRDRGFIVALSAIGSFVGILLVLLLSGGFLYSQSPIGLMTIIVAGVFVLVVVIVVTLIGVHRDETTRAKYAILGAGLPWTIYSVMVAVLQAIAP